MMGFKNLISISVYCIRTYNSLQTLNLQLSEEQRFFRVTYVIMEKRISAALINCRKTTIYRYNEMLNLQDAS
jgi:hypothetical protein